MKGPNPELIDEEDPEWTEGDFAKAVPFAGFPVELQNLLSSQKHVSPDEEVPSARQPAA